MKSINVTVGDATLAKAQKVAKGKKTSVGALLRQHLRQVTSGPSNREAARRQIIRLSAAAKGEVGPRRWTREHLYDR